jgi:hypothetical protein
MVKVKSQDPSLTGTLTQPTVPDSSCEKTVTVPPVGVVPPSPATVNVTVNGTPAVEGSGSTSVIVVVVSRGKTVITGLSFNVTPPATTVIVFFSATVELKENVATPFPSVGPEVGANTFPVPVEDGITVTPSNGLPLASLTVTVIVLLPSPAPKLSGLAETLDFEALGGIGVHVIAKPTSAVAPAVTVTVLESSSTLQFAATSMRRTVCEPGVMLAKETSPVTSIA